MIYSIEKVGSDYVVKVDDQRLMRVSSRRRAVQLVIEASELLLEEARLARCQAPPLADAAVAYAGTVVSRRCPPAITDA
jgi:hypothetical protein